MTSYLCSMRESDQSPDVSEPTQQSAEYWADAPLYGSSLVAAFEARAAELGNERLYTWLRANLSEEATLSYAELRSRALSVCVALRRTWGVPQQGRAMLIYPPGLVRRLPSPAEPTQSRADARFAPSQRPLRLLPPSRAAGAARRLLRLQLCRRHRRAVLPARSADLSDAERRGEADAGRGDRQGCSHLCLLRPLPPPLHRLLPPPPLALLQATRRRHSRPAHRVA